MTNGHRKVVCFSPYPETGPSVRHRIYAYRDLWARRGIVLTVWPFMSRRLYRIRRRFGPRARIEKYAHIVWCTLRLFTRIARVGSYDVVIIHREVFPAGIPVLERMVGRLNPNIIFDLDDATWHPPGNGVNQRSLLWRDTTVGEIMAMSRHVVVGNQLLCDYALEFNSDVTIIPTTYQDLGGRADSDRIAERPVIVWIGNLGNAHYVTAIRSVLEKLARTHRFTLRLIGGDDIYSVTTDEFEIEYLPWRQDIEGSALRTSDIGIMPLVNGAYEQGKCAFKIVQYFSAGLAVVASPVGMNGDIIQHGANGYLADTADEWYAALDALLTNQLERQQMAEQGRHTYLAGFTREENSPKWEALLRANGFEFPTNTE